MKLTLQLVVIVHNAPTKFRDNLFKFTDTGVLMTTTTVVLSKSLDYLCSNSAL